VYHCKQTKVSACLITVQSSNISNKPNCALSRGPTVFHVQIKFKVASFCHASLLMSVSPSHWWILNWRISQPWVWNYYCLCTSILPNHII